MAVSRAILKVLPEVSKALAANKPVVALESTILAHGLPYPENRNLASELSTILRSNGDVVPATIAMKCGTCCVGLTSEDLDDLCQNGARSAMKCSTRDIPFFIAKHQQQQAFENSNQSEISQIWGATTVASTMKLAHSAGITTFVTGGTGGVHRGAEVDMDISADLIELSRTPVVVVSAGVKSILDIALTLEQLETLGVPVAVFGSDSFPAFFSQTSGFAAPNRVDTAEEVAKAYWASRDLGLPNGILICCPNPDPAGQEIEFAIQESLVQSREMGLSGKQVTPYLLKSVAEKTGGASLRSNLALVKRNAQVGADISFEIAKEQARREVSKPRLIPSIDIEDKNLRQVQYNRHISINKVFIVGGSVVDIIAQSRDTLILGTSNPGICKESHGGVARNIAEALGRFGAKPTFHTSLGEDDAGKQIVHQLQSVCGVEVRNNTSISGNRTSTYTAVLDNDGEMLAAIADMSSNDYIPYPNHADLKSAAMLVVDANAPLHTLMEAVNEANIAKVPVFFEPTSVPKCSLLGESDGFLNYVTYMSPNYDELLAMGRRNSSIKDMDISEQLLYFDDENIPLKVAATEILGKMNHSEAHILTTLGKYGLMLASKGDTGGIKFSHYQACLLQAHTHESNVTGAGDTLSAAFIFYISKGESLDTSIKFAMNAASMSVQWSDSAVPPHLSTLLDETI